MSADAVLSLLRKRSADARLWVEAEEWLGQVQSIEAEVHQAQGRLTDRLAEEAAAKESITEATAQRDALIAEGEMAKLDADKSAGAILSRADNYAKQKRDEADDIVASANAKALAIEGGAQASADKLRAATAADLSGTLAQIEDAKASLASITAEIADKQATLDQVNATLRAKIG